jgi:CHAT domain-containing protein/tetratricopeptide (TPR) repeat protein
MSHHARARAFRVVSGILVVAGALVVVSSAVRRDERCLQESNPRGIPLHLLSDSSVVDAFRSIGYVSALTSQQPLHTLFCGMLDREPGPTHAFLRKELDRSDRLIAEAFHTPSTGEFYDKVLKNDETRRLYFEVATRQWRCMDIMYGAGELSPELPRMIEANIRDLERLGLGDWTGYDYECLAAYWQSAGRGEEALDCFRRALDSYEAHGDLPLASQSANKIGRHLLRTGAWDESERYLLESLDYANAAGDGMFASRALDALALLRGSQGYFAEAESLLIRSVERVGSIADPTTEISALIGLAELYCGFGEYSRAGYLVERAILQTERNLADPGVSSDKNLRYNLKQHLAGAFAIQASIRCEKREYDAAVETIHRALEIARETRDDRLCAGLLTTLGDANAARNRPAEAARAYADALRIARRRRDRGAEARITCSIGKLHVGAARFGEAEKCLSKALDLNAGRESWKEEAEMLRLLAGAKAGSGDYRAAEALCSRAVRIVEANLAGEGFEAAGRASRDLVDSLCTDLVLLESEALRDCDSLSVAAEKARILRSGRSARARGIPDEAVRRCVARRDWIPENALVIQHIVTPAKTIVIAMDDSTAEYRSIAVTGRDLARRVTAFVDAARAGADSAAVLGEGRALFRLLLGPVSHLMAGKDVLCFVPDDALRALPFGALVLPGAGSRFLVEEKTVLCSPGLLPLREGSARVPGAEASGRAPRPVLVGTPEISPLLMRLYPGLKNIPDARGELASLRRLMPGAVELVGSEATEAAVIEAVGRSSLVHVATHGVRYPVYGGCAALLLSPPAGESGGENVGASLLTEGEIAALDLSGAGLVVVSSCESAVGRGAERARGYGVGGAFLEAGAQSVVATLWPVEDAAAKDFAGAFYAELIGKRAGPLDALRRAAAGVIAADRAAGNAARRVGVWGPYILLGSFGSSASI